MSFILTPVLPITVVQSIPQLDVAELNVKVELTQAQVSKVGPAEGEALVTVEQSIWQRAFALS